jgi:hypothetical protein
MGSPYQGIGLKYRTVRIYYNTYNTNLSRVCGKEISPYCKGFLMGLK